MSESDLTPEDFSAIWEHFFGEICDENSEEPLYEEDFLESETVEQICKYSFEQVIRSICSGNQELKRILGGIRAYEYVSDIYIKRDSEGTRVDKFAPLTKGAYKLNGEIYTLRKDKDSRKLQVWLFSSRKTKFIRLASEESENKILLQLDQSMKLTFKEASEYSSDIGFCVHCARPLSAEKSIARGMGPVCRSYYH